MAESTVIKEFLVALGFKVDESATKKFVGGITSMAKAVTRLGIEIEATAVAVAYGVGRFASNLEALYFASQRTGASASQLKAFDLAARNFGASMEEAQGSVEGLASKLRANPGMGAVIAGWLGTAGISAQGLARNARGELVASIDLMGRLGQMFQTQIARGQTFLATSLAGQLGISDRTMLAMAAPGFSEELARQERRAKLWDEVAAAAHRFMVQLENLKLALAQLFLPFEAQAMAGLQRLMTAFSRLMRDHGAQAIKDLTIAFEWVIAGLGKLLDWLNNHGDEIQRRLGDTFKEFEAAYKLAKPALEWVYNKFVELDKATDGWSTKLLVLLATLKALGALGLVTGILNLGAGLAKALGAVALAGARGAWAAAGTAFGAAAGVLIAGAIGYGIGHLIYGALPEGLQRGIGNFVGGTVDAFSKAVDFANAAAKGDPGYYTDYTGLGRETRGSPNVNSKIELTMNVNGAGQPETLAKHLASEMEVSLRRVHEDLVREFSAVVR
jgi:hypothetical protein